MKYKLILIVIIIIAISAIVLNSAPLSSPEVPPIMAHPNIMVRVTVTLPSGATPSLATAIAVVLRGRLVDQVPAERMYEIEFSVGPHDHVGDLLEKVRSNPQFKGVQIVNDTPPSYF